MPKTDATAIAALSQKVSGSSQRGSTRRAVGSPIPRSPPSRSVLETSRDTTSENTHVPIAKYASRSLNMKSATIAATAAQSSGASGSTQNGATFKEIEAKNRQ